MRRSSWCVILALLAAGCLHCASEPRHDGNYSQALNEQRPPPASLKAAVAKTIFRPNEEITMHLSLVCEAPFIGMEVNGPFHSYAPEVVSSDGKTVTLSAAGIRLYSDMSERHTARGIVKGRYAEEYDFPITRLYDLSTPGLYTIRYWRQISIYASDPRTGPTTATAFPEWWPSNAIVIEVR